MALVALSSRHYIDPIAAAETSAAQEVTAALGLCARAAIVWKAVDVH